MFVDNSDSSDSVKFFSFSSPAQAVARCKKRIAKDRISTSFLARPVGKLGETIVYRKYKDFSLTEPTRKTKILKITTKEAAELPGLFDKIFEADGFTLEDDNPFMKQGEQRMVLGITLEPDTVDAQGDIYSEEEVRKAAESAEKTIGDMHTQEAKAAKLMGSYLAKKTFSLGTEAVKKGTWLEIIFVGAENLWKKIQSGERTGLSIGGTAKKERLA